MLSIMGEGDTYRYSRQGIRSDQVGVEMSCLTPTKWEECAPVSELPRRWGHRLRRNSDQRDHAELKGRCQNADTQQDLCTRLEPQERKIMKETAHKF